MSNENVWIINSKGWNSYSKKEKISYGNLVNIQWIQWNKRKKTLRKRHTEKIYKRNYLVKYKMMEKTH